MISIIIKLQVQYHVSSTLLVYLLVILVTYYEYILIYIHLYIFIIKCSVYTSINSIIIL